jgi:predicted MFS family arabinose efflux permease
MALYALAIPAGSAVGYLLGGFLGQHFGWRNAFFIVAVPGMLLGIIALFLRETPEKAQRTEHISFSGYKALFKNRTFLLICLAQSVGTFSVGGLAAWMPSYFVRTFGVSVGQAGFLFGAVTVAAGLLGNFSGGWAADWLR